MKKGKKEGSDEPDKKETLKKEIMKLTLPEVTRTIFKKDRK